jgi:hypothetical protein
MLDVVIKAIRRSRLTRQMSTGGIEAVRTIPLKSGKQLEFAAPVVQGLLTLLLSAEEIASTGLGLGTDAHVGTVASQLRARPVMLKPLPLRWIDDEEPGGRRTGCLIFQAGSEFEIVQFLFFGFSTAGGRASLESWPTDRLICRLSNCQDDGGSVELNAAMWASTLAALTRSGLSPALAAAMKNTVVLQRVKFAGKNEVRYPLPSRASLLMLSAMADLQQRGYIKWGEDVGVSYESARVPSATSDIQPGHDVDRQGRRGPIAQEKYVPEHWVRGWSTKGEGACQDICDPNVLDDRHIRCRICGFLKWKRAEATHQPGRPTSVG